MSIHPMLFFASALGALLPISIAHADPVKPIKQDQVIVTFWSPPPATEEALAAVAAQGYNLTWTPESGLDMARKHGLKAMLTDSLLTPATLDSPEQRAKLDALIARVKKHPALASYFLTDEPSATAFPGLGKLVAYLRERDPAHYAYINLFPTYASNEQLGTKGDVVTAYREHLRQYIEVVKPAVLSYDHYHFFKTGDGKQYFLNLGLIRETALQAHIPFVNIIQASTIEPSWRLVNAEELRWLVYTTLAYGGRGISFFLYWGPVSYGGLYQDGKKTPLVDSVAALNSEIAALSAPLMKLDTLGVYHTAPLPEGAEAVPESSPIQFASSGEFVLGLFGSRGKANAFMVVNRSYKEEATAKIRVPTGTRRMEEYDRTSRRWKPCASPDADHTLSIPLKPGDGRLFRLAR